MTKKRKQQENRRGSLEAWVLLSDIVKLFINRMTELLKLINKDFMDTTGKGKNHR